MILAFSIRKEYYKKTGKAWKRAYLLNGPLGTGKSTMTAAMVNRLNYSSPVRDEDAASSVQKTEKHSNNGI